MAWASVFVLVVAGLTREPEPLASALCPAWVEYPGIAGGEEGGSLVSYNAKDSHP